MSTFKPIFDFIRESWETVAPWVVILQYEEGVILRFGKYLKRIGPGFHWKWPVIDTFESCNVAMTTISPEAQTVHTKDGMSVVIQCVIKYRVVDAKIFLIEVEDARDALADITQGFIRKATGRREWKECLTPTFDQTLTEMVRSEAKSWGIKVLKVTLKTLGKMKSFRLITGGLRVEEK